MKKNYFLSVCHHLLFEDPPKDPRFLVPGMTCLLSVPFLLFFTMTDRPELTACFLGLRTYSEVSLPILPSSSDRFRFEEVSFALVADVEGTAAVTSDFFRLILYNGDMKPLSQFFL